MVIVEIEVVDDTWRAHSFILRQPDNGVTIADDEVALSGKVLFAYGYRQIKSPFYEVLSTAKSDSNDEARPKRHLQSCNSSCSPSYRGRESCMDASYYVSGRWRTREA